MAISSIFRRRYLVKPGYQLRLALTLFTYIIAYSIILGFIMFYPLYREIYAVANVEEQARASAVALYLHKRVWLGMFVVAVLAAMHAVLSSHRIVGPIERFEKMIEAFTKGDYSRRIRIRKKDEMKELEYLINNLAESLEKRKALDSRFREDLDARLKAVLSLMEAGGHEGAEDARKKLKDAITDMESLPGS